MNACILFTSGIVAGVVIGKATEWYDPGQILLTISETDSRHITVQYSSVTEWTCAITSNYSV